MSDYDDDEDPVDVAPSIEAACKPRCMKYLMAYQGCVERVQQDTTGEAHCTGQYFDYWGCIDKCAAPQIFAKLK